MSSSGFGIIRAVNSGDSVSIYETIKSNGPPPVRDISLSNVQAPKLGYNNTEDKPWAWKSREFLRELCIGKRVKFTVDHKTANEREFGSVITDSGLDLGIAISEAGWAEIRSPPDGKEPRTDAHRIMLDNQNKAKEQKIGIWQEDISESLPIKPTKLSTMEIYDKYKEQTVDAIIEYVRDANCVTVILLDSMQKINIRIAGIDAPRVPSKVKQEEGEKPEPVGLESRFFVEKNLLHRTVKLTITAPSETNRKNEFYGGIELAGHTLASQLIKNGYAKLLEWSAVPNELPQLKQYQQDAISKKLRVWKYVAAPNENTKTKAQWTGRIKEIRDGGALVIKDSVSNEKKFVILSNVKVPRIGRGDPEPYGYQARELLRKKTLGKQVTVIFDYDRNDRDYVTVLLDNKSIALFLVESGYAKVVSFEGNAKSSAYQLLTIAENRTKSQNKNIWGKKAAPIYRVTDTTLRSNDAEKKNSKQKAKQFYGALQRAGRVTAIVEHVMNGSRFKLSIPKENCIIMFGLEAIKTLSQREEDKQPLGIEAYNFSYDKLYQRDVEVIIESIDMAGNFFGSLFIKQKNFGITLLEMGYATLNNTVDRTTYALEYKQAEEEAKNKKKYEFGLLHHLLLLYHLMINLLHKIQIKFDYLKFVYLKLLMEIGFIFI